VTNALHSSWVSILTFEAIDKVHETKSTHNANGIRPPLQWPQGIKTRLEMDQCQTGTPPTEFASDLETLRILFERFYSSEGKFAPHTMLGQMSRTKRMRHAYLHMDHHLRQFGA